MDFSLSSEQACWQRIAREFVNEVIKPTACERDHLATAEERSRGIGFAWRPRLGSERSGSPGVRRRGRGHLDYVACRRGACGRRSRFRRDHGPVLEDGRDLQRCDDRRATGSLIPRFVDDPEATLAIAITEPAVGSDHQGYHDHRGIDFRTVARREGDEYVLNGHKRYVSNGCMAKLYFVAARTTADHPLQTL